MMSQKKAIDGEGVEAEMAIETGVLGRTLGRSDIVQSVI